MPKGGKRLGAGRPRGSVSVKTAMGTEVAHGCLQGIGEAKVTPNSFPSIHAQDLVVNPAYMGDYLGIAADKLATAGGVIAAWGDNSLGDPNVASAKQIP